VNERYQVSKLRKSALAVAEQKKASVAGSALLSNQYVSVDASWLTSAFIVVTKANDKQPNGSGGGCSPHNAQRAQQRGRLPWKGLNPVLRSESGDSVCGIR
jgi:hypothetical protein